MDHSTEKFKTQLHIFTPNEQINILEKIKKDHILWTELMKSTLNEQIEIINNRINILEKIKKRTDSMDRLNGKHTKYSEE